MKFIVKRTSLWIKDECPCEEAVREKIKNNEMCEEKYTIEIKNLDELTKFIKKYGDVVIRYDNFYSKELAILEIYDDYRE